MDSRHLDPVSRSPHLLTTTGLAELVWDLKQEVMSAGQVVRLPGWEVLWQVFPARPHCQHFRPGPAVNQREICSVRIILLVVIFPVKQDTIRKSRPSLIFSLVLSVGLDFLQLTLVAAW